MADGSRWLPVYIGLGANLGDCRSSLAAASAAIGKLPGVVGLRQSALYRSKPMGPQDQPDYLNSVCAALTTLEPAGLLRELQQIERQAGRDRQARRWGPRALDLDILVFGSLHLSLQDLIIPHPGLGQRNFVLYPLAELAPRLEIPGVGVAEKLAAAVGQQGLERLG